MGCNTNHDQIIKTHPFWVKGVRQVPNGHTSIDGVTHDALRLVIMATLHLRTLHKSKSFPPKGIYISCHPRLKKAKKIKKIE